MRILDTKMYGRIAHLLPEYVRILPLSVVHNKKELRTLFHGANKEHVFDLLEKAICPVCPIYYVLVPLHSLHYGIYFPQFSVCDGLC